MPPVFAKDAKTFTSRLAAVVCPHFESKTDRILTHLLRSCDKLFRDAGVNNRVAVRVPEFIPILVDGVGAMTH